MTVEKVQSIEELRELYDAPMELVVKKQKNQLDEHATTFIHLSSFAVLATSNAEGMMDCSPRGDYPGFIHVVNKHLIALPDRPGNNRLDSLSNIIENPHVGLLVLIPGFNECLRINGSAEITTDENLIRQCEHQGKRPKTVILVSIQEIYFHCAKAITRSQLWKPESLVDRSLMPSLGKILMDQIDPSKSKEEVAKVETLIENRVKTTLY